MSHPVCGARYGIVMKCGPTEAHAIKQQPMEQPPEIAESHFMANRILIALSLSTYLKGGFAGTLLFAPYMRHKPVGVPLADPARQKIGLSDLTVMPEPTTIATAALILLVLAARQRLRCRP